MTDVEPRPWSLRRRLGGAFTVLAVILLIAAAVAGFAAYRFVASGNEVIYRWQRAEAVSAQLLDDYVNQETGLRGYELTGDPVSLAPYREYEVRERADVAELRRHIGHDKALSGRLQRMLDAAERWSASVAAPAIRAVRRGQVANVSTQLVAKAIFDRLRVRAAELNDALAARAEQQRTDRTTDGVLTVLFAAIALVLVTMSGVTLWRGLGRWLLQPMGRLGAQTREVSSGETHRPIVPDGPAELLDLGTDVETMRLQIAGQLAEAERTHAELVKRGEELARSNEDLQQFAYVASHDLSEPLRKVANFCQLLERQYGPQLDDRARQYIWFAVDGAKRMQALITDLLALSRVGRSTERFEPVDLDQQLDQALTTLATRIAEADARVERLTPLPTVDGDRSLLASLLENLVGNAVKYRRADVAPVVQVAAEPGPQAGWWTFTVSDNGIGIDPEYGERIFAVFQRLHLRDQYGGTGIGLALCRRIVEFHDGRIWLADVGSGQGATFRFTLPKGRARAEPRD